MAKIKPYTIFEADYGAYFYHCGGVAGGPGNPWHGVYPYLNSEYPLYIANVPGQFSLTMEAAILFARELVALPLLSACTCPFCWDNDFFYTATPRLIRWNIYRGQNRIKTVPCVYWDWFNDDPPPGFNWDGS